MRVLDLMTKRVETIAPTATVSEAIDRMRRRRIRHVVVVDGANVVGVVSDRDVRTPALFGESVSDVMGEPPITIGPNDTVRTAANRMRARGVSSLPVVDGGRLVGILTVGDLLEFFGRASTASDDGKGRPRTQMREATARHGAAA